MLSHTKLPSDKGLKKKKKELIFLFFREIVLKHEYEKFISDQYNLAIKPIFIFTIEKLRYWSYNCNIWNFSILFNAIKFSLCSLSTAVYYTEKKKDSATVIKEQFMG